MRVFVERLSEGKSESDLSSWSGARVEDREHWIKFESLLAGGCAKIGSYLQNDGITRTVTAFMCAKTELRKFQNDTSSSRLAKWIPALFSLGFSRLAGFSNLSPLELSSRKGDFRLAFVVSRIQNNGSTYSGGQIGDSEKVEPFDLKLKASSRSSVSSCSLFSSEFSPSFSLKVQRISRRHPYFWPYRFQHLGAGISSSSKLEVEQFSRSNREPDREAPSIQFSVKPK